MFTTSDRTAARRAAALVAGTVLVMGAVPLVLTTYGRFGAHTFVPRLPLYGVIFGSWFAAAMAGALTFLAVQVSPALRARPLGRTGPFVAVSIGMALLAPTTLHAIAALVLWAAPDGELMEYLQFALAGTALAHLVFATLVGLRARALARGTSPASVKSILWSAVLAAVFPFGFYFLIPPALVALTALCLVPALHAMERYAAHDRAALELPLARMVA